MKEYRVSNFAELHEVLHSYRKDNRWLFRGHSSSDWLLIPKSGRDEFAGHDDERIFRAWKRRAAEFISLPFDNDWDWLAIAQHHGLATRLLDWTYNPLAAAFFAVTGVNNGDALVFVYKSNFHIDPKEITPFEVKGVAKFKPTGVAHRIVRQGGIFTIHENPSIPMEQQIQSVEELEKIIIVSEYRKELVFELSHYGVNASTLFPDLDGLSNYVNWATSNRTYWAVNTETTE